MTADPHWYDLDDLPRGRVHVRVRYGAYVLAAAAMPDKRDGLKWYEVVGRELRPMKRRPEAWQPLNADAYVWPLGARPTPLPVEVSPRMASVGRLAFAATDAAEEMENDVFPGVAAGAQPDRQQQWWRDASLIRYEAAGDVTRLMAEGRLMRALALERLMRLDMAPYRSNAAALADLKRTLADVLADVPDEDWTPPLRPAPADWADFEVVMGWVADVWPSRRAISVLRARMLTPPATWVQIGDEHRMSATHAKRIYNRLIDLVSEAANRSGPGRRARQISELQERNRAARRDGGGV